MPRSKRPNKKAQPCRESCAHASRGSITTKFGTTSRHVTSNLDAADRLIDHLEATLNVIASAPDMGRIVGELAPDLRSFPIGSYLIFYRPIEDGIPLIRVLHGARDITPEYFAEK